ncbi:hypothetical protein [Nocardia terpenica]|uniref:Vegetative cell wall protein gp1 n=1 Tax=Nocardia terpenica TaxID=455432 RepID=A0A6G9Z985_9NOCA|nr:hypothetical protein [Nocardia terpenica]QIS22169.1 hypothetical protein F6W96_31325 [Nocardia terpenica]
MSVFFQELAKKLAERWVTLLLIPGALFVTAASIGVRLGQRHALDYSRLRAAVSDIATTIARQSAGSQVVVLVAVLLAAVGAGLAVQAMAGVTRAVWLGLWPWPLAWLRRRRVTSRRDRWNDRWKHKGDLQARYPRPSRNLDQQREIDAAAARVNRLALTEPGRPTWMGDRIHSLEYLALHRHGLDLVFAWPRLWLVMPDATRAEITTAHAAFASAVATGTWAWPYLLLGAIWWPAALVGIVVGTAGWVQARAAITDLTALSEAALDLHGRALATALGVAEPDRIGPLTMSEGEQLTDLMRRGR